MRSYLLAQRRAEKHLTASDRSLAKVIAAQGKCSLIPAWDRSPYESLVRAVAHQQLHARAAEAILGRVIAKYAPDSFPLPEQLVAAKIEDLRSLGLSAAKVTAIQGIAAATLAGQVPTRTDAEQMSDTELIAQLIALRGIGRWTVEMLLIFTLGRLDVMPIDDFGVKVGLQSLYKLETLPKRQEFARLTDGWHPYRSIGAWYLWRVADSLKVVKAAK